MSVYDSSGMRVQTTASGVIRTMVYDINGHQVGDYVGASPERENIYRGGQLLAVVETPLASPPTSLAAATSGGGSTVTLSWSAASGATNYRVERKGANSSYVLAGTTSSTTLIDTGVSSISAYLYRVCTANSSGNCTSSFSNLALGSTATFSTDTTITGIADDPTGVNVTTVKAAHITELRTAVNAVRTLAGLAAATWTNTFLNSGMPISAVDVGDLRTKLDEALALLGLQTSPYDDPSLAGAPNGTLIKKVHIAQLRQRATSGAGSQGSGGGGGTMYVLSDAQGSSRAVMNNNGVGASTIIARHDYLPFGEEIGSSIGSRSLSQGYSATDNNRQKYALTERDNISGLDHTWFRKYESLAGRWTSPDPLVGNITNPQSLNRYTYVNNDPLNSIDPDGLECITIGDETFCWDPDDPSQSVIVRYNPLLELFPETTDWSRGVPPTVFSFPNIPFDPRMDPLGRPLDQAPTRQNVRRDMNIWRAKKHKECLKSAARDYQDRQDHLMKRYEEAFLPTTAPDIGQTVGNIVIGSLGSNLAGILLRIAITDAYFIPKQVVARQRYERDVAGCHSLYDQR